MEKLFGHGMLRWNSNNKKPANSDNTFLCDDVCSSQEEVYKEEIMSLLIKMYAMKNFSLKFSMSKHVKIQLLEKIIWKMKTENKCSWKKIMWSVY